MAWHWPWRPPAAVASTRIAAAVELGAAQARALAGGRVTQDDTTGFSALTQVIQPPSEPDVSWYTERLDSQALLRTSPARLMQLLADLSPDVSKALWDWLRFTNPGYEVHAYRPGVDTVDERATAQVEAFLARLQALSGSVDAVIGRLFTGAFFRGAFFAELVLDARGRQAVDLATPDPVTARFRKREDAVRGTVWELGQWQGARFVSLAARPTVRYLALDPFPGSPYGRPMVSPALFPTLFLLSLLHDLKRVIQQQGYPRLDVSVDLESLKSTVPPEATTSTRKWLEWVQAITTQVQTAFRSLQPDDTYVHASTIQVNRPVGTVDASSLGAVDGLIQALERWSARALKMPPFLMGLSESNTETQAIRQLEAFAQSIRAVQHYAENLLGYLCALDLRVQGIQADVRWRFAENRASEQMRDEQVQRLRQSNAAYAFDRGWIGQAEAAERAVGHAPDQPAPRLVATNQTPYPSADATRAPESAGGVQPSALVVARGNGHYG